MRYPVRFCADQAIDSGRHDKAVAYVTSNRTSASTIIEAIDRLLRSIGFHGKIPDNFQAPDTVEHH